MPFAGQSDSRPQAPITAGRRFGWKKSRFVVSMLQPAEIDALDLENLFPMLRPWERWKVLPAGGRYLFLRSRLP